MAKSNEGQAGDELGGEVCKLVLGRWLVSNLGSCRRRTSLARLTTFIPHCPFVSRLSRDLQATSPDVSPWCLPTSARVGSPVTKLVLFV